MSAGKVTRRGRHACLFALDFRDRDLEHHLIAAADDDGVDDLAARSDGARRRFLHETDGDVIGLLGFGIAATETTCILEKRWAGYRKERQLDLYGKGLASNSTHIAACVHPQVQ